MKCPNCGFANEQGAPECLKCQVIFGKLAERAAKAEQAPAPSVRAVMPAGKLPISAAKRPSLAWVLGGVALAGVAAWFFLRPPAGSKPAPAAPPEPPPAQVFADPPGEDGQPGQIYLANGQPVSQQPEPGAVRLQPPAPAPSAAIENPWKFEGSVVDLLRGAPVEGVALNFFHSGLGLSFSTVTDQWGRYSIDLQPLLQGGYEAQLAHPGYDSHWWDTKYSGLDKAERYRLAARPPARSEAERFRHVGRSNSYATYDFALFPARLSAQEERERAEARAGY